MKKVAAALTTAVQERLFSSASMLISQFTVAFSKVSKNTQLKKQCKIYTLISTTYLEVEEESNISLRQIIVD